MKKFFMIFLVLIIPMAIIAQTVEPPENIIELITNINLYFGSLVGIAAAATFVGALLNGLLKVTKKFVKQLVVWLVCIVALVGSNLLNFGYAKEFTLLTSLMHGLGAGLVANGIFDVPIVNAIMNFIEGLFNKQSE